MGTNLLLTGLPNIIEDTVFSNGVSKSAVFEDRLLSFIVSSFFSIRHKKITLFL